MDSSDQKQTTEKTEGAQEPQNKAQNMALVASESSQLLKMMD